MKYRLTFILGFLHLTVALLAQSGQDSITVMAKKWSRDKNRNIVYSDWTAFKAMTVGRMGMALPKASALSRYGGNLSAQFNATGFFRIEKNNGKQWMVDPEGMHSWVFHSTVSERAVPRNMKGYLLKNMGQMQNGWQG